MDKNFTVTLSHRESSLYPGNEIADFSTKLYKIIPNIGWTVALAEIHLNCKLKILREIDCKFSFRSEFKGQTMTRFINIPLLRYKTVEEIIRQINKAFKKHSGTQLFKLVSVSTLKARKKIVLEKQGTPRRALPAAFFQFTPLMAKILGGGGQTLVNSKEFGSFEPLIINHFKLPEFICIYSSILVPGMIGNGVGQLLKIVRLTYDKDHNINLTQVFNRLDYIPVIEADFSSVNIKLRTITGGDFPTLEGNLTLNLNFEKALD